MHVAGLVIVTFIGAFNMTVSHACPHPTAADASVAIRALNEQYIAAARHSDPEWFDGHMAADVIVVLGSGLRLHKPDFLARLRSEPMNNAAAGA